MFKSFWKALFGHGLGDGAITETPKPEITMPIDKWRRVLATCDQQIHEEQLKQRQLSELFRESEERVKGWEDNRSIAQREVRRLGYDVKGHVLNA